MKKRSMVDRYGRGEPRERKPTREEIGQALAELAEKGLIVDSGRRRNGQIVWVALPEKKD